MSWPPRAWTGRRLRRALPTPGRGRAALRRGRLRPPPRPRHRAPRPGGVRDLPGPRAGPPRTEAETPARHRTRRSLDAFEPHASCDLERAYKANPHLAHETAAGRLGRAVRTLKLEAELRASPDPRADRFVQRWRQLDDQRERAYVEGDYAARRRITNTMGQMALGLERNAQVESLLADRKRELGLGLPSDAGRSLGRNLAWSIGFDMGRSRGLGI